MPEHTLSETTRPPGPSYLLTAVDALAIGRGGVLEVHNVDGGRARLRLPISGESIVHRSAANAGSYPQGDDAFALTDAEVLAGHAAIRDAVPAAGQNLPSLAHAPNARFQSREALVGRDTIRRLCRGETVTASTADGAGVLRLRLPSEDEARALARGRNPSLHWCTDRGRQTDTSLDALARAAAVRIELPDMGVESGHAAVGQRAAPAQVPIPAPDRRQILPGAQGPELTPLQKSDRVVRLLARQRLAGRDEIS